MRPIPTPAMFSLLIVAFVAITAAVPSTAEAREPRVASDAFYVGMRVNPGVALMAGWDLDIYMTESRAVSLGPGVSVAVLGEGEQAGMEQDVLLSVDVLRLKVGLNEPGGPWRPYALIGGGFSFASLPEQVVPGVTVTDPDNPDAPGTAGVQRLEQLDEFAPLLTMGFGADLFTGGAWGLAAILQLHYRLGGNDRIPDLWSELAIGIRFGI